MYKKALVPKTNKNHIGIEIEFLTKKGKDDAAEMSKKLVEQKLTEFVRIDWENLDNEKNWLDGWEAKILVTETNYHRVIPKILAVINEFSPTVNNQCGLHVHVDARNRDADTLFKTLVDNQDTLFKHVAEWRKDNVYCQRNKPGFPMNVYPKYQKYWAINPNSMISYQTLEIRLKESTLDTTEILTWIDVVLSIVNPEEKAIAA